MKNTSNAGFHPAKTQNSGYNPDSRSGLYPELQSKFPEDKIYYNRNLPHIQPPEGVFFITFRLAGSLPKEIIEQMKFEREKGLKPEIYFQKFETLLDSACFGPTWLKNPGIAQIVADSLHHLDGKYYKLVCYTIMPNHVHVILYKIQRLLFNILNSIKRHSARQANILLNREGAFWQKESYDRLIRNRKEFNNKVLYTLNNPVKAGLTEKWNDWQFSYCNSGFHPER